MTTPISPESREQTKEALLQRAVALLGPLVRLLLHFGVDHPSLSAALKKVFVREAAALLQARGQPATHTALGLLAGLQRPDIKRLRGEPPDALPRRATLPSLPMQALARWTTQPRYLDEAGNPRALPLRSDDVGAASFEQLADSVSKNVHPTALIDELVRLNLARFDGRLVTLLTTSFVPQASLVEMLDLLAGSTGDHLAAAVSNVLEGQPRFLEYSLVADELRPESAAALHALAKRLGRHAYQRALATANELIEADRVKGFDATAPDTRIRFGMYFYAQPKAPAPTAAPAASSQTGAPVPPTPAKDSP